MNKVLLGILLIVMPQLHAKDVTDEVSNTGRISSFGISAGVANKISKNLHYKVIGACGWIRPWHSPKFTMAVEHFLPDLIVTVYNRPRTNPWYEVNEVLHSSLLVKGAEKAYEKLMKVPVTYGESHSTSFGHGMHLRRPLVDVIGNPFVLLNAPFALLQPDTTAFKPHYLAMSDLVASRLELPELAYALTHSNVGGLVSGYPIGTQSNHWGFELPRHMAINNPNRFKAAVVAAMQAADIVTNTNPGHVVQSTSNSCGINCVVSNVVYDPKQKNIIWQEVYPNNRNIKPGIEEDRLGIEDDKKGNGNYVFVVWRKYRGCIQGRGRLFMKTVNVGSPQKR